MQTQLRLFFTMIRWELLRVRRAQGMLRRALFGLAIFCIWLVLTAVTLGWMFQWPLMLILLSLFPLVLLMGYVADSFAGERERGTLETLLLAPVPDWMIVCAKVVALELIALLASAALLLAHALVAQIFNITSLAPAWYFFAWYTGAVVALIMICAGVIVSWSAASVQAAQQLFAYIVVGLSVLLLLYDYLPTAVVQYVARLDLSLVAAAGTGTTIILLILVIVLFRRDRLLLR